MKKKLLFMVINMNVGGTEKALLNMIEELPKDKYEITILMLEKYGGFLSSIPINVHVEYVKDYSEFKNMVNDPPLLTVKNLMRKCKFVEGGMMLILYIVTKLLNDRSLLFKYLLRHHVFKNEYDVAVAYAGPMDLISYFVLNKIKAKKKIQWIHFDVTKIGFNLRFAAKNLRKFDVVFVVSEEAKKKLIEKVPVIREKVRVFFNIISSKIIQLQSREGIGFIDKYEGLRILTVGRLSVEKGQDLAIRALDRLIKDGYNVKWYCLGEGNERSTYEELLKEYQLEDKFVLLGADSNPYPYMKQCDIYVQPSRYEGYCITLSEARCLNRPIVTTEVNGAREQINNGITGLIVNIDDYEIYKAVKKLINNIDLCKKFTENLAKETSDSTKEIQKIYDVI
ncbi:glycosyltransferase [Paenibacillus sp. LHD-38]|uniref:glycosyltransferase n=1 Tax=Paenibacillus sp. LHD-38 TaxID=3072143 RepID=UPI00280E3CC3|nr:glycosyltransferase [Paenibacillus sp. LHD-38]MDQ8735934.1 glycosyltransferase [Paenibacillus sp. LHD-38]